MNARAIVYVSETGYTKAYADMLGRRLHLPVHTLKEAEKALPQGTPIIYMGWLMAGSVKDCRRAAKRFAIQAVCGVGLGDTGAQDEQARKACNLPAEVPVFTVQGGMDLQRMQAPYRFAIRLLTKAMAAKKNPTPDESRMTALLQTGGNYVDEKHLAALLAWAEK